MAYVAEKDNSVNVLHVIRDVLGDVVTASTSGLSVVLLDPSQNDDSSLATWTEPVVGGYVNISVTPDEIGNWLLAVTDPTGTDEATYYTAIETVLSSAGLTPSGTYLTTLANVREQLGKATADTADDAFLTNLIARASVLIESRLGRSVVQASYTEYVDGDGTEWLRLRQGPIISVTSVSSVDWTGGTPSLDALDAGAWIAIGDQTDDILPGRIRGNGTAFAKGRQNWAVVYSAGFSAVPYDIERLCIDTVIWWFTQRKDAGANARDIGSGSRAYRSHPELIEMIDAGIAPYMAVL